MGFHEIPGLELGDRQEREIGIQVLVSLAVVAQSGSHCWCVLVSELRLLCMGQ